MNSVQLVGRLTRDPEIRYSTGENSNAVLRGSLAVNRSFKNKETGQYDADFPTFVAWGNTAEFISKYFKKGSMIGLQGEIRTGSFTNKDGQKVYTTEVWVSKAEFVGGKNDNDSAPKKDPDGFENTPDDVDDLPFN